MEGAFMELYAYWFILALLLAALEMATGTFYMLVLGLAAALGGSAAAIGLGLPLQMALAAMAGIAGVLFLRNMKRPASPGLPDAGLDVGSPVKVIRWNDNGLARVQYRGAEWDAELEAADTPREGPLYIKAMRGSTLILTQHKP